jgi:hypothetical protein
MTETTFQTRKSAYLVFAVLFLTIMNGCAFGTRNITLNKIKTDYSYNLAGKSIYIEANDKRDAALKSVVGHVKNGYGMKTADVIAERDATNWVKTCIEDELIRYGAVSQQTLADNTSDQTKITVDLLVCYAQAFGRYGAEIRARILVRRNMAIISDKEYSGKAILGMNWAATAESYQQVLELAMKDFLDKTVPDLVIKINS